MGPAVMLAIVLATSGCVETWIPVADATRISNDRIRVAHPDDIDEELEHARSCGPTLIGVPALEASGRSCDCATSCRILDVTRVQISMRRAERRPVSDYVALAVSIVGTAVLVTVAGLAVASGAGAASGQ